MAAPAPVGPAVLPRRRERVPLLAAPLWAVAGGTVLAAAPFLLAARWAADAGYVSPSHAGLAARGIGDAGGLRVVGADRPPLAAFLGAVAPSPFALSVLACLAAGAIVVLAWSELARTGLPAWQQAVVALGAVGVPSVAFVATERVDDVLLLLTFLLAWRGYVRFLGGETAGGFVAGLWLGVGVAVEVRAVLFALPLALLAPLYAGAGAPAPTSAPPSVLGLGNEAAAREARAERRRARLAAAVVVGFPALTAVLGLAVVALLGNGEAWRSLVGPRSDLRAFGTVGPLDALRHTAVDVALLPVNAVAAVVVFRRSGWRRTLPFLVPIAVIAATRLVGWSWDQPLALATLVVVGAGGLPSRVGRRVGALLVVAACAQLALGLLVTPRSDQVEAWRAAVVEGHPADDGAATAARILLDRPDGSTLADPPADLVARMGTTAPFLLPGADGYGRPLADLALAPAVLLTDSPDDEVAGALALAADEVPDGFTERLRWPGGRLLVRDP